MPAFERWDDWACKLCKIELGQVRTIVDSRRLFEALKRAWADQDVESLGDFAMWVRDAYVAFQGSWVRKIVDEDEKSYSFVNLLKDVASNARHVTRQRLYDLKEKKYRNALPSIRDCGLREVDEAFDRYVGKGESRLTESISLIAAKASRGTKRKYGWRFNVDLAIARRSPDSLP
jgi:hypothetical protein